MEGHLPEGTRLPNTCVCKKCRKPTAKLEFTTKGKQYKCNRTACMHIEIVEVYKDG